MTDILRAIIRKDQEWRYTPSVRVRKIKTCDMCSAGIGTSRQLMDNGKKKEWVTYTHFEQEIHKYIGPAIVKSEVQENKNGKKYEYEVKTVIYKPKKLCGSCYKKYGGNNGSNK